MLKEVNYKDLQLNPMTMIGSGWWAVACGNETDGYNAMTAAWGQLGTLFERGTHSNRLPTAVIYIRPNRYTHAFMEKEDYFSLNVMPAGNKKVYGVLGSRSGRDTDKFAAAGITTGFSDNTVYINEAELVFICHKIYHQDLKEECFNDKELIDFNYPKKDFHTMYIGEITKVLRNVE